METMSLQMVVNVSPVITLTLEKEKKKQKNRTTIYATTLSLVFC